MVTGPYKHPIGMDSDYGMLLLDLFGQECVGNRMLQAEKLYRNDKLTAMARAMHKKHDLQSGFLVKAEVTSQHRLQCPNEKGTYAASIKVLARTDLQIDEAITVLQ